MKQGLFSVASVFLVIVLASSPAMAFVDWSTTGAHVKLIEGTYMPNVILFAVDASTGPCSAGSFIEYDGQGADLATQQANAKAIYALLMAAKLSGQPVSLFGSNTLNGAGRCVVQFVHLSS